MKRFRLLVVLLLVSACSNGSHAAQHPSSSSVSQPATLTTTTAPKLATVTGTLRMIGGPSPGVNRTVSGNVTATNQSGQRFSTTARDDGNFAMELPPGVYDIVGHSPNFGYGKYDCSPGGPVTLPTVFSDPKPKALVPPTMPRAVIQLTCPVK
jgi:hypothetical protein